MSGGGTNQRYTVDQVEKIGVADGKGEVLLMAKRPRGKGFGLVSPRLSEGNLQSLLPKSKNLKSSPAEGCRSTVNGLQI
jgi:hypothetical protein